MALDGDEGKGSGRSNSGFDLHSALTACSEHLVKFGGHPMAAGLTIKREAIEPFREAFNSVARDRLSKDELVRVQRVDVETPVRRLDADLERLLRHLEPCGMGNPAPVFAVTNVRAERAREVGENHLKFTIQDNTGRLEAIGFELADRVPSSWLGRTG